jgi:hypothetical protein
MCSSMTFRIDLDHAIHATLRQLATPGTWWTGAQRLAMVRATVAAPGCSVCLARKEALSPTWVPGPHDHDGALDDDVVDAIHRIATDPSRLDEAWFKALAGSSGPWVELIGLVALAKAIDSMHLAAGLPFPELPPAVDGEPSRYVPEGLTTDVCWAPTLNPRTVAPRDADVFPERIPSNVGRTLTSVPDAWRLMNGLLAEAYVPFHKVANAGYDPGRTLRRPQMEAIATRVSLQNECFY